MKDILMGERIILRKFTQNDIEAIFKIFGDTEINKFLPWFPIKNLNEAKEFYKTRYENNSDYKYAICLKENNIPIGYINISSNDSYDLGYGLLKEYWGNGIILEACKILVESIKNEIPYITATHDRENIRSGNVMKRLGMKYCYSYEENWQPKNKMVIFRMYQLNFKDESFIYKKYWDMYSNHFIEKF